MNCVRFLFASCFRRPQVVESPKFQQASSHSSSSHSSENQNKYKKQTIPPALRDEVWIKYHGVENTGCCYCCGTRITKFKTPEKITWQCSHVKAEAQGGQLKVSNLRTCCKSCNCAMGDMNLYAYIWDQHKTGPGKENMEMYFAHNPKEKFSKRTNNFKKKL